MPFSLIILIISFGVFLRMSLKVVREYDRLIVFRLGKADPEPKGPGLVFIIPVFEIAVKVSLQPYKVKILNKEFQTKDGKAIKVDWMMTYQVIDPMKAIIDVEDFQGTILKMIEENVQKNIAECERIELEGQRQSISEKINKEAQQVVEGWGIMFLEFSLNQIY